MATPATPSANAAAMAMAAATMNTEEMKVLRQTLRQMKQDVLNEKKLLNDFQQQKEKIEQIWAMEKKRRDDLKMQLRNKLRQKQDLEEKHAFELKVYKQKVKHFLHETQSNMTDVRFDGETKLSLQQDDHRQSEHELELEIRTIKVLRKQMELAHTDLVKSIKLQQEKMIMDLRIEFQRKAKEVKEKFEQRMDKLKTEMDLERKRDVDRLDLRKATFIQALMHKHKKAFDDIKDYYRDVKQGNLEHIRSLKEKVQKLRDTDQGFQAEVDKKQRINKRLSKPLEMNEKKLQEMREQLATYEKEQGELEAVKAQLEGLEQRYKNKSWELEVAQQKYEQLERSRAALREKLEKTVYNVQQKAGFRNLMLERKISATSQDAEKIEAALSEVLASTNLAPSTISDIRHNLEDILMSKNKTVQKLEDELIELKQRYAATIKLYEAKLREYSIPVQDLGFFPNRTL